MGKSGLRALSALFVSVAIFAAAVMPAGARPPIPSPSGDNATIVPGLTSQEELLGEEAEGQLLNADAAYILGRTAGDSQLSNEQAGAFRAAAANARQEIGRAHV